jgi:hypothetical protein
MKDVNSRRSLFFRVEYRHFLSYRSLISVCLCFLSKAIFALRVSMPVYILRKKRGTKSIRNEATAVEKEKEKEGEGEREEIIYVTISLSLFCLIVVVVVVVRRAAAHYG